jgi:hypothetical protein
MIDSLSACVDKIDRLVQSVVALVTQCDPLQLLSSVYWHMNVRVVSPDPVPTLQKEDAEWIWTLSYVQNVIASISPTSQNSTLDADDGALMARRLIGDLMQLVSTAEQPTHNSFTGRPPAAQDGDASPSRSGPPHSRS